MGGATDWGWSWIGDRYGSKNRGWIQFGTITKKRATKVGKVTEMGINTNRNYYKTKYCSGVSFRDSVCCALRVEYQNTGVVENWDGYEQTKIGNGLGSTNQQNWKTNGDGHLSREEPTQIGNYQKSSSGMSFRDSVLPAPDWARTQKEQNNRGWI